jgi:uncharacterized protein
MNDAILATRERAVALFDEYQQTLTATQRDVFSDYYLYDLSFSEIADNRKISRSAVNDALKKALEKMELLEKQIGCLKKRDGMLALLRKYDDEEDKEAALAEIKEYAKNGL